MFGHIFRSRFKLLIRSRADVFWTLLYPIILALFFFMAFSNLATADNFHVIPIAVVENDALKNQQAFTQTLKSVSDDSEANKEKLFHVTYTTRDEAEKSLLDNEIKGYIIFDAAPHVVVKESGFQQSFIKEFMDSIMQIGSSAQTIVGQNPSSAASLRYTGDKTYLSDTVSAKTHGNMITISFYSLIAMATMFGGFWGRKEIEDIQANFSPQAMRLNLAPLPKMKTFTASISAAIAIHFLSLVLLVAFMAIVLHVGFGDKLVYILIACFFASIMGVTFGAFIASIVRNPNLRIAVMLAVSLILSAISGMIQPDLKYTVTQALPIMAYINPANLVSDAFYSLYCYSANTRFFINLALMLGFSVVFSIVVYMMTRRQKYASL
jgi:ABC-2 type transport system permease protein